MKIDIEGEDLVLPRHNQSNSSFVSLQITCLNSPPSSLISNTSKTIDKNSHSFFLIVILSVPLSISMATTTYLQSLHHSSLNRHHSSDILPSSTTTTTSSSSSSSTTSLFLKPTFTPFKLSTTNFTLHSTSTTSATTTPTLSFDLLQQHLSTKDFRQADEETRRLIILLAGEASQKRGYVFFSETQFIPDSDLKIIDSLWRRYSDNKFGYSVQKKIYEKEKQDFSRFFQKVGWMKKLDTEMEQYNYRAFPNEFIWEIEDNTPEGHLPLTNALRGTQLLKSILYHPAFESEVEDEVESGEEEEGEDKKSNKSIANNLFKTDYSF